MQDLTPLEIQKQTFARALKGYNADEVRAYLHLVAEEIERLLQRLDRLSRENAMLRDELEDHSKRERILKDTLLSAQKVSEDVTANARKEAELIVKDAELLSERLSSQAMQRVGDLERAIQDLKIERRGSRNKLQSTLDTIQQMVMLDAEQEANEQPITAMFRRRGSRGRSPRRRRGHEFVVSSASCGDSRSCSSSATSPRSPRRSAARAVRGAAMRELACIEHAVIVIDDGRFAFVGRENAIAADADDR